MLSHRQENHEAGSEASSFETRRRRRSSGWGARDGDLGRWDSAN